MSSAASNFQAGGASVVTKRPEGSRRGPPPSPWGGLTSGVPAYGAEACARYVFEVWVAHPGRRRLRGGPLFRRTVCRWRMQCGEGVGRANKRAVPHGLPLLAGGDRKPEGAPGATEDVAARPGHSLADYGRQTEARVRRGGEAEAARRRRRTADPTRADPGDRRAGHSQPSAQGDQALPWAA